MNQPQQYLLDLSYLGWHKVSDIPKDIAIEVIELIDENYHCSYLMNDNWDEFKKVSGIKELKINESFKRKGKVIILVGTNTEFDSINEASRILKIKMSHIQDVLRGDRKTAKGCKFKFK